MMSDEARKTREALNPARDHRIIRDYEDIEIPPSDYECTIFELGELRTVVPGTYASADELCTNMMRVSTVMDALFGQLKAGLQMSEEVEDRVLYVRDAVMQQMCCTDQSMTDNTDFIEGTEQKHFRFDIVCFEALIEVVACLSTRTKILNRLAIPLMDQFPHLCKKSIIKPELQGRRMADVNVYDLIESLKCLEFKWCSLKYHPELPDFIDLLLARVSEIYKIPQSQLLFHNIIEYMKPITSKKAVVSGTLVEELCWSFRPMNQKIDIYQNFARRKATFFVSDEDALALQILLTDNARLMNNKTVSETFRTNYLRFALRPSELFRFYRDKKGRYANSAVVMKNIRSVDAVNRISEKLDKPAWIVVDVNYDKKKEGQKRKGLFDKAGTDMMYILLMDSLVGNMWQIEWIKTFVVYNTDMLEQLDKNTDTDDWFRVPYPLIVQSFNHFDVFHQGVLYEHQNVAKAFCQWYKIMLQPPFKGRFQHRSLDWHAIKKLKLFNL